MMHKTCPGRWPMALALRAFREQIRATFTRDEILRLQAMADAAMIGPPPEHWTPAERVPLITPLHHGEA